MYIRWDKRRRNQMAESVISHGKVSASCGQAYQISAMVILYIDLIGSMRMRRAKIAVADCQDRRQKVVWGKASLWRTEIAVWRNLFYWSSIQIKWIPLAVSPPFPSLFKMENKLVLLLSCWSVFVCVLSITDHTA